MEKQKGPILWIRDSPYDEALFKQAITTLYLAAEQTPEVFKKETKDNILAARETLLEAAQHIKELESEINDRQETEDSLAMWVLELSDESEDEYAKEVSKQNLYSIMIMACIITTTFLGNSIHSGFYILYFMFLAWLTKRALIRYH